MTRKRYYKKRQIIDITDFGSIDFDERILICVPRFAWIVARSYLSVQAQWESSYATEYFSGGYEGPSAAELDVIKANVADFLAEVDMSCDLEAILQDISDILQAMVEKECSTVLSCTTGSSGAGGSEASQEKFEDVGTDPPLGFPTYGEYEIFKCAVATLIVQELERDLEWLKNQALTSITAVLFAGTLLSPIPGDEVVLFVGLIASLILEALLDSIIQDILDAIGINFDDLVCDLFLSIDVPGAAQVLSVFGDSFLGTTARYLLSFFINNDNLNRLFRVGNFLLPTPTDCSTCAEPALSIEDSFTDDDDVLLPDHTPELGGPWVQSVGNFLIEENQARTTGATGSRVLIGSTLVEARASLVLTPTSDSNRTADQGIIFRVQDGNNYLAAGWRSGGSAAYWIAERVGGTWSQLTSVPAIKEYSPRTILVKMEGDDIDLFIDGIPTLGWTTTRFNSESGFGVQMGNASGGRVDNFLVRPLS